MAHLRRLVITFWIFGETLPAGPISPIDTTGAHQLGDGGDLALAAMVAVEAPGNLDHALDQLTTATDLFDVPVLDFQFLNSLRGLERCCFSATVRRRSVDLRSLWQRLGLSSRSPTFPAPHSNETLLFAR